MKFVPLEMKIWDHPVVNEGISNATLSSCLLLYDDNHFLTEWLAFHYQTLPLRRLIVATDPRSRTSPSVILQRWKPFINITEWKDYDYFPLSYRRSIVLSRRILNTSDKLVTMHRYRQRFFYLECMRQLRREHANQMKSSPNSKRHSRNWVTFIDVDEFLFPNRNWKYQFLLEPSRQHGDTTIAQLLHRFQNYKSLTRPCVSLPRLLIGTKLDDNKDDSHWPEIIDFQSLSPNTLTKVVPFTNLLTWTWIWHGELGNLERNKAGKALIDLSRVPSTSIRLDEVDVHRPIMNCCTIDEMWINIVESPLVLHHYVGSLEQFTFRNDPRTGKHTVETYAAYQDVNFSTVHPWDSRQWLIDFVRVMGLEKASYLMQGVGEVEQNASTAMSEEESFQVLKKELFPGTYNSTELFVITPLARKHNRTSNN